MKLSSTLASVCSEEFDATVLRMASAVLTRASRVGCSQPALHVPCKTKQQLRRLPAGRPYAAGHSGGQVTVRVYSHQIHAGVVGKPLRSWHCVFQHVITVVETRTPSTNVDVVTRVSNPSLSFPYLPLTSLPFPSLPFRSVPFPSLPFSCHGMAHLAMT